MTPPANINLNSCVEGQKLRTRAGEILTYKGPLKIAGYHRHVLINRKGEKEGRTNQGMYFFAILSKHDIVEILPL